MRVLLVHNAYQQRGGEDAVFEAERALLRSRGHEVIEYRVANQDVARHSKLRLALGATWSHASYRALRRLAESQRPDVAHFHNTLPLISPSAYYAMQRIGVPVVQTLHNYRLLCPSALLYRNGQVCRDCVGRTPPLPSLRHACYRDSRSATAAIALMLTLHRWRGTYANAIDRYIVMTEFARQEFVAGGLSADQIAVKPNFLADDPGVGDGRRGRPLFVGRLTEEKAIRTLIAAAERLPAEQRLTIVGDGPLRGEVAAAAEGNPRLQYAGALDRDSVLARMRSASVLVFPSRWFEGFPMTIVEAFACGLPVVASDLGSMASIVDDDRNGKLVDPGNVEAWADTMAQAYGECRDGWAGQARADFERRYSAEPNYRRLIEVYRSAGAQVGREPQPEAPAAVGA